MLNVGPKGTLASLLTAFYLQSAVLFIQGIPPEIHHTRCCRSYPAKEDTDGGREEDILDTVCDLHRLYERKMDKEASKEDDYHFSSPFKLLL